VLVFTWLTLGTSTAKLLVMVREKGSKERTHTTETHLLVCTAYILFEQVLEQQLHC
jgi:hypothetical protein